MKPAPPAFAIALTVVVLALAACVPVGLFFSDEVDEYYPNASWGALTSAGGCPSHTPAIEVHAKNPDWLWIRVGIWDSKQTHLQKLKEPTLFVHVFPGWHLSIAEQKRRAAAAISITSPTPYVEIALADGTSKRVLVERFNREYMWRTAPSNIPLDVTPQSMIVTFPDLLINGEPLRLGAVRFTYRKSTRHPC
ncbi:MAG: hypothetical protein ACM3SS_21740 [Rhodospirillaceae bacterium]